MPSGIGKCSSVSGRVWHLFVSWCPAMTGFNWERESHYSFNSAANRRFVYVQTGNERYHFHRPAVIQDAHNPLNRPCGPALSRNRVLQRRPVAHTSRPVSKKRRADVSQETADPPPDHPTAWRVGTYAADAQPRKLGRPRNQRLTSISERVESADPERRQSHTTTPIPNCTPANVGVSAGKLQSQHSAQIAYDRE